MAKTMIASVRPMTDGQLENAVAKFRDALRKHRNGFDSDAVQQVLGVENLGMELLAPFRTHYEEAINNTIIRVDRSVRPSYPNWVGAVMYPELECTGLAEYDITNVEQWLHDGQERGKCVRGHIILAYLEETDALKVCLGLRDLEEIQKKGIAFFRKHFQGKAIFGWKSAVRHRDGDLRVPCLYEGDDGVLWLWLWLGFDWDNYYLTLRFAS